MLMRKVSMNGRSFRVLPFDLELTGKTQELQNEINCMNDSRDFQDAESVSAQWTFPRYQ